jgi:hypothetical protein
MARLIRISPIAAVIAAALVLAPAALASPSAPSNRPALGNGGSTVIVVPSDNHMHRVAPAGQPVSEPTPPATFVHVSSNDGFDWADAAVGAAAALGVMLAGAAIAAAVRTRRRALPA